MIDLDNYIPLDSLMRHKVIGKHKIILTYYSCDSEETHFIDYISFTYYNN